MTLRCTVLMTARSRRGHPSLRCESRKSPGHRGTTRIVGLNGRRALHATRGLGLSYFELDDDVGRNPSTCGTCEPAAAGLHLFDADPQVFPGPGHRLVGVRPGRVVSPGRADVAALAVTAVGDLPVPAYGFPVWPGYAFGGAYRAACCRVSLDSAALALTSAAADAASSRTVAVESVAVALTSSRACWAGSCRFPAISLAVSVRSSTMGWAVSFTACAACCSARLAGSIEDNRRPAPKAIRPAAIGEPWALRATAVGASDTVSPMLSATRCPVSAASEAEPSTASLTEVAAPRTRPTCRLAMLPGFTLSPRAFTFSLSSLRVRSISRRICSGSLLIGHPQFSCGTSGLMGYSLPLRASGIFFTVSAVFGMPRIDFSDVRPTVARTAAMIAQITATMSADQPRPVTEPIAHHTATDRNSNTKYPAIAAPPSMPAPFPARAADCCSSALANSSSCRISVDRSWVTSEINSPSERSPAVCWAGGPTSAGLLTAPPHPAGGQMRRSRRDGPAEQGSAAGWLPPAR